MSASDRGGTNARLSAADVIVVGAGPAGSATALLLARAGVHVLLLDRHRFPRSKPCGDCLSAAAGPVLRRLGVLERIHALPHARLAGWRITAPGGDAFEARFDAVASPPELHHALAIERSLLDAALLDAAIAAGAVFRPGARVHDLLRDRGGRVHGVRTTGETLPARLVVGADGLRSVVAARLGAVGRSPRLPKVSLTARIDLPAGPAPDDAMGEMHVGDGLCAGLAPINAGGRFNLTIVADAARFGRDIAAHRAAFAARALASLPGLRGRLPAAAVATAGFAASGPFHRPVHPVVHDGAVLIGDAAGYFDPFTGQGIFQALRSAELLVPIALHALERDVVSTASLRPWVRRRRRLLAGSRVLQQIIDAALDRPARADRIIARLAGAPGLAAALVAVTGDVQPPSSLLSPRAWSSLLLPATPAEGLP